MSGTGVNAKGGAGSGPDRAGAPPGDRPLRAAVVGARRRRQGTGEWVARELARQGCQVTSIVGTAPETLREAQETLRARYGIEARGYETLGKLLAREAIDVVAICSPAEAHHEQLDQALASGCHVFCEKPLWWRAGMHTGAEDVHRAAEALYRRAESRKLVLSVNAQWPFTLPAFRALHPGALDPERAVRRFRMWLSPTCEGPAMVVDAGSHFLSMVHAVLGEGDLGGIEITYQAEGSELPGLTLHAGYRHRRGTAEVELVLTRHLEQPRPAGYAIDGRVAERRVELPNYALSFVAPEGGRSVPVPDPLAASVEDFVRAVRARRSPDRLEIVDAMTQLRELVAAAVVAAERREGP